MNENKIGALWVSSSSNPRAPFARGEIIINGQKLKIVVWKNNRKRPGERYPDYTIDLDKMHVTKDDYQEEI
jgi:hypothetical protein